MIHVVAAAVTDAGGRILIAQRPSGKQLAGYWEFPGGKLEPGETRQEGLARELREELGISISNPRPLMRVRHRYDFGEVLIDLWVVSRYSGAPLGLDGQRLRWCTLDELDQAGLLPSDKPLVRALRLPERLISRDSLDYAFGDLSPTDARFRGASCKTVDEAVSLTARADFLVVDRAASLKVLSQLCAAVDSPVYGSGISLERAWESGATGVSELLDHSSS